MPRRIQPRLLACLLMAWLCQAGAGLARQEPRSASSQLIQEVAQLIRTGDQAAYERYARGHYAPATLQESSAAYQASLLARIYTDTAGFQDLRLAGEAPGWIQAEARARITGLPYCLTVSRARTGGRDFITEVSARSLHPAGPGLATPGPSELTGTLDRLARAYERRNLFSGVILIARGDRVLFRRAYGYASPRRAMRMRLDTRLNTASIAKMFTGVAIAQLVESGRLSFDDNVGRHWPDFPNPAIRDRVTIRQLLTHTSGLGPKDYYDDPRYPAAAENLRNLADYLRLAVDTPLEGTPGTFTYSNSGYLILGGIIERVTGQDFYATIRERVFRPAGMTDSLYAPADVRRLRTAASLTNFRQLPDHSYLYELGRPIEGAAMGGSIGGPQGGAWVTADDLYRFSRALREGRLLRPETFARMIAVSGPAGAGAGGLTGEAREGLGVEVIARNGHIFYGHTGGDFGIASLLYWYPESGYTTILLSNRDPRAARLLLNVSRALITRRTLSGAAPPSSHCTPPG